MIIPPTPRETVPDTTEPPAPRPIESFDLGAMVLPMDPTNRTPSHVACHQLFKDLAPVDVALVDRSAMVRNAEGRELGSVTIESVRITDLAHRGVTEALVIMRCTTPERTVRSVAIFDGGVDQPVLFYASNDVNGYDDVVNVELGDNPDCALRVTFHSGAMPANTLFLDLRRTATTMEMVPVGCWVP